MKEELSMKKYIALLLCLLLALGCVASAAEETPGKITIGTISINGAFSLRCGLPEGYRVQPLKMSQDQVVALILAEDPLKPVMQLSVAFDEAYSDVKRMNDLDDEALDLLEKTFTDMDPTVEITYGDTGLGTRLLIARQSEGSYQYIDFLSVYQGYVVEFVMVPSQTAEDKTLTEDQMRKCIDFLTDLDFVPADIPVAEEAPEIAGKTWLADLTDYDEDANTLQVSLKRGIVLDPETVAALQVGDTLVIGRDNEPIRTLEKEEDGSLLINEEIVLQFREDGVHAFMYEHEYMETFAVMAQQLPDGLVFLDYINPETGEPLETPTQHEAAELAAMMMEEGYPDFASDNVYVTFGDNGEMTKIERHYTPWQ